MSVDEDLFHDLENKYVALKKEYDILRTERNLHDSKQGDFGFFKILILGMKSYQRFLL